MKANRKFVEGEEAVSAVIGVILMVAITVAIAATVYYYVTTILPEGGQTTPNIIISQSDEDDYLKVISADSDLAPPIVKIKKIFPEKRIIVAFPPNRFSKTLSEVSDAYFVIGRGKFSKSLFPDEVIRSDGFVLKRPSNWD